MKRWTIRLKAWLMTYYFQLGVGVLMAIRCLHLGSEIDSPHDWRQCDTAHYIRDFYRNGIDLFHPAVCWMGATDTLALEFPLPEAIVALSYHVSGESIPMARLIFICFFVGAIVYFHKIVRLVFDSFIANLSTLVYLALPLSIYYSRAIHIDFFVVFLTHMMAYWYLKGIEDRRWVYILGSCLAAGLACMVKIPYVFIWIIPLGYFTIRHRAIPWILKWSIFYVIPLGAFVLWQKHAFQINSASPDLSYILGYHQMLPSPGWYFGTLAQRLSLYSWWILLNRGIFEIVGTGGLIYFIISLFYGKNTNSFDFLIYWGIGLIMYVLVFFNLNLVHNYYQIPFLAPIAVLLAIGIKQVRTFNVKLNLLILAIMIIVNVRYTEKNYFKTPEDEIEIAALIQQHTPGHALVAVTYNKMDCRNPKILYRADRRGWSIQELALKASVIQKLQKEQGAQYWAFVGQEPNSEMSDYLKSFSEPQLFPLKSTGASLYLFKLEK